MKDGVKEAVKQVLTNYLEQTRHRKTPERFAVLDVVYSFPGHFSINELSDKLEDAHFHVCKATLYNTLKLFMDLRLVVCHRIKGETRYETSYVSHSYCRQICTKCGKVTEVKSPSVVSAVEQTHLKRFRKEGFTLYIYGTCSTCQAKMTRQRNKNKQL
ncbi:MAG: transcriptional repressor [Prevotella sp.]|nr:transcriptional repressor [Prevotella sp.]MBR1462170.1 transcriptional repressor [Prevotella sp.]